MALVFVPGTGNRDGRAYARKVALRDARFQRFLLARAVPEPAGSKIRNPLWGESGTAVGWSPAMLPTGPGGERLDGEDSTAPTDALWAPGAYFRHPTFHARLAARVREARS